MPSNAAATDSRSVAARGELVEQIEVRGRIEQHLVLVLAVKIDQPAAQLAQRRAGDERAVHRGAAASLRATSRRTIISRPSAFSKIASTAALSSPVRTRSAEARPPTRSPTAPTTIDLPAPGLARSVR